MGIALTAGVRALLIANTIAFFPTLISGVSGYYYFLFALQPSTTIGKFFIWQVITYSFLHANLWHYLFNMLALYMFGIEVEEQLGTKKFLIYYFVCGASAGIISIPFFWHGAIVGASGAIFGVLYFFAKLFPYRQVLLFFLIPVPALTAVWVFGVISLFSAFSSSGGNIAHLTHIAGLFTAWLLWKYRNVIDGYINNYEFKRKKSRMETVFSKQKSRQEYFDNQVDPILEKVSEHGIHTLTDKEKQILAEAKKYRE